jgi:hypothetical protein
MIKKCKFQLIGLVREQPLDCEDHRAWHLVGQPACDQAGLRTKQTGNQVSILPMFYEQLLHTQIPKAQ